MMFVIIISKKLRINPDNIATPIAGWCCSNLKSNYFISLMGFFSLELK